MTRSRLVFASLLLIVLACGTEEENPTPTGGQTPTPQPRELTIPSTGYLSASSYEGLELVWSDEFDGDILNESDWNFEIGTGRNGWGNLEEQYYTKENTSLVDGNLVIEAKRASFGTSDYTSSRITTKGKQEFKYGRIDVRAVMPSGNGMWPAIWMLGANFSDIGWPRCGEIDIMEMFGDRGDSKVFGTVHWDNAGSNADYGGSTTIDSGTLNDKFHVFSIVWDESFITWYIDDRQFHVIDITPSELEEFREKFFFIFNVAVGGDKGAGNPANTTFPQWMIVDYIRVFQ